MTFLWVTLTHPVSVYVIILCRGQASIHCSDSIENQIKGNLLELSASVCRWERNCYQEKLQKGRPDRASGHQRACDSTAVMKPGDASLCHLPLLAAPLSPSRSRGQRRPWEVAVGSAPTAFPGLTLTSDNLHEYLPYFQELSFLTACSPLSK